MKQGEQQRPTSEHVAHPSFLETRRFWVKLRRKTSIPCALLIAIDIAAGAPLRLAQSIPLPGVEGRIDHISIDMAGNRLFLCALGNNSVEVVDLRKSERTQSITGLGAPQGVAYVPGAGRLYVANEKGGVCNIYEAGSLGLLSHVDFHDDADNVRYDERTKRIYVGYGNGSIGIVDAETGKGVGSIPLSAHPEAFVLERNGSRIFVNVPTAQHVAVVDRAQARVVATWKTNGASANFPMAIDEQNHRLFIGCRTPAKLVVLNTESGQVVTTCAISGDPDDVFYDQKRRRLYVICGAGSIDMIDQVDRDSYRLLGKIDTARGARTGLFVPELNSLFVAVPHHDSQVAEVRRFAIE